MLTLILIGLGLLLTGSLVTFLLTFNLIHRQGFKKGREVGHREGFEVGYQSGHFDTMKSVADGKKVVEKIRSNAEEIYGILNKGVLNGCELE